MLALLCPLATRRAANGPANDRDLLQIEIEVDAIRTDRNAVFSDRFSGATDRIARRFRFFMTLISTPITELFQPGIYQTCRILRWVEIRSEHDCATQRISLTESLPVFDRRQERLHHFSLNVVAVELIQLGQPEVVAVKGPVGRVVRIPSQVTEVLH
jgi:hypothetical protein